MTRLLVVGVVLAAIAAFSCWATGVLLERYLRRLEDGMPAYGTTRFWPRREKP